MKHFLFPIVLLISIHSLFAQNDKRLTIDKSYLDKKVKPTEDFFLFSNGKWIAKNKIPASESRWGSFNELEKNNKKKLLEILEIAKKNSRSKRISKSTLGRLLSILHRHANSQ